MCADRLLDAGRHHLLDATPCPGMKPHLDAMGVAGRWRQDILHEAASALPVPLILLLGDAHLEPWCHGCTMLPGHVVHASCPCGRDSNASRAEWTMQDTLAKNTLCSKERLVVDPVFPILSLSYTQRLAYTVYERCGRIDTDARALVPQR